MLNVSHSINYFSNWIQENRGTTGVVYSNQVLCQKCVEMYDYQKTSERVQLYKMIREILESIILEPNCGGLSKQRKTKEMLMFSEIK